jgi:hypothetical protein
MPADCIGVMTSIQEIVVEDGSEINYPKARILNHSCCLVPERKRHRIELRQWTMLVPGLVLRVKPYPSVSGNTKCCSREGRFVLERI